MSGFQISSSISINSASSRVSEPAGVLGGTQYWQRVMALSPLAYWPLTEAEGSTSVIEQMSNFSSTVTNVTFGSMGIGDGKTSALFGVGNINIYSTALRDALNYTEFSVLLWAKMTDVAAWTDGLIHVLFRLSVDASNELILSKRATNYNIQAGYRAGNVYKSANYTQPGNTDYFCVVWTVSKSNDRERMYINGAQSGSNTTGLGVWSGVIANAGGNIIGANTNISGLPWPGNIAHVAIWTRELAPSEVVLISSPF